MVCCKKNKKKKGFCNCMNFSFDYEGNYIDTGNCI